jgi:hypothetical protein
MVWPNYSNTVLYNTITTSRWRGQENTVNQYTALITDVRGLCSHPIFPFQGLLHIRLHPLSASFTLNIAIAMYNEKEWLQHMLTKSHIRYSLWKPKHKKKKLSMSYKIVFHDLQTHTLWQLVSICCLQLPVHELNLTQSSPVTEFGFALTESWDSLFLFWCLQMLTLTHNWTIRLHLRLR